MNLNFMLKSLRRSVVKTAQLQYVKFATQMPAVLPNFLCIGAPRAATTWLHKRLQSHPSFFLPKVKELHFFDEELGLYRADDTGLKWNRSSYFDMNNESHWRWYSLQFQKGRDKIKGDITPYYSTVSRARVELILQRMPRIKVIYIIRNPVERAWSGVRKTIWYQKGENDPTFQDMDKLMSSIMHPEVLIRGDYKRAIENWGGVIPKENMLYLFYDDIVSDSDTELDRVYSFLDPKLSVNTIEKPERSRVNSAPKVDMPDEIRQKLQNYYEEQIQYIESQFSRDLSHWRADS